MPGDSSHHHGRLRLAVLDDHPIVGAGVVAGLSRLGGDVELIGTATCWSGFLDTVLAGEPLPDLVLVDVHLNDGTHHADVVSELTRRGVRTVLFTSDPRPVLVRQAIAAGVSGLILKSAAVDDILKTIERLRAEPFAACSDIAQAIVTDSEMTPHLGPRELETMRLLSRGLSRAAVARSLSSEAGTPLSAGTVNTYVNRVVAKYRAQRESSSSTLRVIEHLRADGYLTSEPH